MTPEVEPISEAAFAAAHLRFSRNLAVVLCAALAEGGATMAQVNRRLGKRNGWAEGILARLLDGRQKSIDPIGTILWAAGGYLLDFSSGGIGFRKAVLRPDEPIVQAKPGDAP